MTDLHLKEWSDATAEERKIVARLSVTEEQAEYGGTFLASVSARQEEGRSGTHALVICASGSVVGIVLLKRPPVSPDWAPPDMVTLHGLKIDRRFQGRGLGRQAFEATLGYVKAAWPEATSLGLSVDADNQVALSLYRSFGMADSGPVFTGRLGKEHRLTLALSRPDEKRLY